MLTALPDAWKLSNDGLYAYAYVTGNSYLTVYSLESGEKFRVDVSSDFALSVKDFQKTKDIRYFISLNDQGNELLICYSLSDKQAKPKDNTLQATKDAFVESNSIEEFILRFEELCTVTHTYKVYKGEGFTHLFVGYDVVVEDYRTGTFTIYGDSNYDHTGISDSEGLLEYERIVALSSTKEQTDLFLKNRGLKASDATVDYAAFYENGKFSRFKAMNFITTPEYLDQINGFNCWFNSAIGSFCKDLTYLRLFMAELNDCQKSFTASAPFDWSDAADVGHISLGTRHVRIWGTLCTKGVYWIAAGNNDYFVPEYVFADLITLSVFSEFNRSYTLTEGNKMTTDDLRTIFKDGLSKEEFAGYAYRLLSDNRWGNGDRLLFPVYEGEEQIGYAYIKIRSDGSVEHMTLFDTDYRYIGYPAIEGIHSADVMLRMDEVNFNLIAQSKVFHCGTLSLTHPNSRMATIKALEYAKESDLCVSVDPNLRMNLWKSEKDAKEAIKLVLRYANIVKISDYEIDFLYGNCDINTAIQKIAEEFNPKVIFITCGKDGAYMAANGNLCFEPCIEGIITIDTTGAGDCFCGAALSQLLDVDLKFEELTVDKCEKILKFANASANLSTTKYGAIPSMPTVDEILEIL